MNEVQLASLAWLRDRVASATEIAGAWGNRLATWLIVGNSIALFTVVSSDRAQEHVLSLATPFLWGLCITFTAGALSYLLSLIAVKFMASTADALSEMMSGEIDLSNFERAYPEYERNPENPLEKCISNAETKLSDSKASFGKLTKWVLLSVSLFAIGAGCFVYGAYNAARSLG